MNHLTEQWAKVAGRFTFERVTYRPEGSTRSKTIFLQNVTESGSFITGIEVGKDGDEVAGTGFDERQHIIEKSLVIKRTPMRMDNDYGLLVEAATQTRPIIFYPAEDGRGKWHASKGSMIENTLCGVSVLLDQRSGNSIHVNVGDQRPHPICCKVCLRMGGWKP